MPIRPENLRRYPGGSPNSREWKALRASILERAGNRCEQCGVPNRDIGHRSASRNGEWVSHNDPKNAKIAKQLRHLAIKIILTIAHLDHTPENNDPANLKALCQLCHNRYDAAHRAAGRKARKKGAGRLLDGVLHDAVPGQAKEAGA